MKPAFFSDCCNVTRKTVFYDLLNNSHQVEFATVQTVSKETNQYLNAHSRKVSFFSGKMPVSTVKMIDQRDQLTAG
jgi:hypothetical protein